MKQKLHLNSYLLAAAVSLGCIAPASAQDANIAVPNPASPATTGGLLGSRYSQAEYMYLDLDGAGPNHAHGFKLAYNQPLNPNVDVNLGYDWARADYLGYRFKQQDLDVGATTYAALAWGRPFATAAVGWQWQKGAGYSDSSFRYKVGVGTEFQVANAFVVTPFVNFVRATGFNDSEVDVGVKAAYRVTRDWSVTASAQYDAVRHEKDASEYTVGMAYHF